MTIIDQGSKVFHFIIFFILALMIYPIHLKADISGDVMERFILPGETDRICEQVFVTTRDNLDESSKSYVLLILETATRNPVVNQSLGTHTKEIFLDVYQTLLGTILSSDDPIKSSLSDTSDYVPASPPQESNLDQVLKDYLKDKAIIDVPNTLPGHQENLVKTTALATERIEIPDIFDRSAYRQSGNETSCIFLSMMASFMKNPSGRAKIRGIFKGTDDKFAYFKFYEPTSAFMQKTLGNQQLVKAEKEIKESVYKVPLNIIETSTNEDSYPKNSPSWLHLLMRAYHYLVLSYKELFWWFPDMGDRFSEVSPTICEGDRRGNMIYFSPLVGKEQLTLLRNAPGDTEYDPHLKDLLKNNNGIIYGRNAHALALLADGKNVSTYNTLGGIETQLHQFNNLDAMTNDGFIAEIFAEIARQNAGPYFYYSAEPLDTR